MAAFLRAFFRGLGFGLGRGVASRLLGRTRR